MKRKDNNIINVLIPPDKVLLTKAYKLVVDKDIKVAELLNIVTKDQALVLEIFRAGNNALIVEYEREIKLSEIIHHISFFALKRLFQDLKDREIPSNNKLSKSICKYRAQANQISEIASILAKYVDNGLVESVRIGGLFVNISYILVLREGEENSYWIEKGCSDYYDGNILHSAFPDKKSCLTPARGTWIPARCEVTQIAEDVAYGDYSNAGFEVVSPNGEFAAIWAYTAPEIM